MKSTFLIIGLLSLTIQLRAQELTGTWKGSLKLPGVELRLVFNIAKNDKGYTATLDSPDQGAKGITVTEVQFQYPNVKMIIQSLRAEYTGTLEGSTIRGNFSQAGQSFPVNLAPSLPDTKPVVKPQDPVEPYPYYTEEVTFTNTYDTVTLAGTLSVPSKTGNYPVVILITGSGPQNRNEELLGHKPFLVLADYLTRKGIGVLRYDDRGVGKSKGNFATATSQGFARDTQAAIDYLKTRGQVNKKYIGLIGHSEGGLIAPMVAAQSKDVSFIVLLAGPGITGDSILLLQSQSLGKESGLTSEAIEKNNKINREAYRIVKTTGDLAVARVKLRAFITEALKDTSQKATPPSENEKANIEQQVNLLTKPWYQFFLKYNPADALQKVKCPVLVLNGEKDTQVPAVINTESIKANLFKGGNKKVTVSILPGLNHLFQECTTGMPNEYARIEQTFSPVALAEISEWIAKQVK